MNSLSLPKYYCDCKPVKDEQEFIATTWEEASRLEEITFLPDDISELLQGDKTLASARNINSWLFIRNVNIFYKRLFGIYEELPTPTYKRGEMLSPKVLKAWFKKNKKTIQMSGIINMDTLKLTRLTTDIGKMNHITILDLSNNLLTTLPDSIFRLRKLTLLDLACNRLTDLSPKIKNLEALKTLKLWNNQISALPEEIALLEKLQHLDIQRNPAGNDITPMLKKLEQEGVDVQAEYNRNN